MELIAQKISIHQVELSTILGSLETTCNNVTFLFDKLYDTSIFSKDIKYKISKIDEYLKESSQKLQLDPSYSSTHYNKIRFLIDMQVELLREEARTRAILIDIQGMILPNMDVV